MVAAAASASATRGEVLPAVRNAHDAIIVTAIQYEKTAVAVRVARAPVAPVRASFQHVVRVRVRVDNVLNGVHEARGHLTREKLHNQLSECMYH